MLVSSKGFLADKFVLNPSSYVRDIETFLDTRSTDSTKRVLRSQLVPRKSINLGPKKKIYQRYGIKKNNKFIPDGEDYARRFEIIKQKSTPEIFKIIETISKQYEKIFGLWF